MAVLEQSQRFRKLARACGGLLFLSLWAIALLCFCRSGDSVGNAFLMVGLSAALVILSAGLFCRLYLGGICSSAVHALLWPRRFLKQAPPALGPVRRCIVSGDLDGALEKLQMLLERYPDDEEVLRMTLQLMLRTGSPEADAMAERYFALPDRGEDSLALLLDYADHLSAGGRGDRAVLLLNAERDKKGYSPDARRLIRVRCENAEGAF